MYQLLDPQRKGRLWELVIRNFFAKNGYATFQVLGSGPPCDIIAFVPPPGFSLFFPIRYIERSESLEQESRKEYIDKFSYQFELVPRVNWGFLKQDGAIVSLQAHLIAFQKGQIRFIWAKKKTKARERRINDRIVKNYKQLLFIETKALAQFNIRNYRRTDQFKRQMQYAETAGAAYETIVKVPEGAIRYSHLKIGQIIKTKDIGLIFEWNKIM